ncbi:MAG: glycoside hydrolase family 5 protein, partial [Lachnospiraceae bacterium]|nr:glycoside hydrolase family 5 protein [Lachnospiraceae bacterium]
MNKKIQIKNKGFVYDNGQQFTAHGINMVCKEKAKGYIGNYTSEDFRFLKENGFNLIRLGVIWDGAEPEPGKYDEEYFKKLDRIIDMAAAEGIPVFLDMHQDLYGVVFEDGAPEWATVTDDEEHIRTGLWSESYLLSAAVQHAFDNFWKNTPAPDGVGIRDHYRELWKFIAKRYAKNPYVIGYDLMNEPFPGSDGAKIFEIITNIAGEGGMAALDDEEKIGELISAIVPITAAFETEVLTPFYSEVASAIRE